MAKLVEYQDIRNVLSDVPGRRMPDSITPERVEDYIAQSTALVFTRFGATAAPPTGTPTRGLMNSYCIRLVVNLLKQDVYGDQSDMLEVLRRERKDILEEMMGLAPSSSTSSGPFIDIAGAR